jgi:hypothetical protein
MMIVQQLIKVLPEPYFAEPLVHLRTFFEVDVATYRDSTEADTKVAEPDSGTGGVAIASYAPPQPTLTFEPQLPDQDVYEVRIYDSRRDRRLVAAIEIVSPSNKDRPECRGAFVSKVVELLKNDVCVSIVDIVSTMQFNLYGELLNFLESTDPALSDEPPPMYAATVRSRYEDKRKMLDTWYHPLEIGGTLPTLPVWLKESLAISLELEASYEETCRALRIR